MANYAKFLILTLASCSLRKYDSPKKVDIFCDINVMCRRCHAQPEILCEHTKGLRIKRHAEVKTLLAIKLQVQNEVFVEPTIKVYIVEYV